MHFEFVVKPSKCIYIIYFWVLFCPALCLLLLHQPNAVNQIPETDWMFESDLLARCSQHHRVTSLTALTASCRILLRRRSVIDLQVFLYTIESWCEKAATGGEGKKSLKSLFLLSRSLFYRH